jgi:hypothetical protein
VVIFSPYMRQVPVLMRDVKAIVKFDAALTVGSLLNQFISHLPADASWWGKGALIHAQALQPSAQLISGLWTTSPAWRSGQQPGGGQISLLG